jgi:hypothetical protein
MNHSTLRLIFVADKLRGGQDALRQIVLWLALHSNYMRDELIVLASSAKETSALY